MADVPLESSPQPPTPRGNQVLVSLLLFLLQLGAWPAVVAKELQSAQRSRRYKQKTIRLCVFIGALILAIADASLRMVVPEPLALAMIALVYYWGAAEYYVLYQRKS